MSAFTDRRFRRMYIGDALSGFGDTALVLALGIWVKDLTGSSSAAGAVFLATGVPVLFGPLAGRWIDRVNRKSLLLVTNGLAAIAVLALLLVRDAGQVWIIYGVAVAYGSALTVLGPARHALFKDMLPDGDLGSANAAFGSLNGFTRMLAPLAGAGIYAAVGGHALAVIDALTFLAAIVALATVRVAESRPEPMEGKSGSEILAGLRSIRSVPLLAQITKVSAIAFGTVGILEPLIFVVIQHGLDRPPTFFGVLASLQGAGAIVAGLTGARLLRRTGEGRLVGGALVGLALASLTLAADSVYLVAAAAVVGGAAITWFAIGWNTALQRHTPPRLQGRVFATAGVMVSVPQTVSIGLGAVLITAVDYRVLLAVLAVVTVLCGLRLLIRPAPEPAPAPVTAPAGGNREPGQATDGQEQ
jgi:MFS family permease